MTKKDNYIKQLREARVEHKKWLNQIRLIISGVDTHKDSIELNQSESAFGKWLYSTATVYSISKSTSVLEDIEELFNECYKHYHQIYGLLFMKKSNGLLNSLFGTHKASSSDYKVAEHSYENILNTSDKLLNKLRVFETQLHATNAQKFEEVLEDEEVYEEMIQASSKSKEQRYYRGSLIKD